MLADARIGSFCAVRTSEKKSHVARGFARRDVHVKLLRNASVKIVACECGELDFRNLGGVITAIIDRYAAREESVDWLTASSATGARGKRSSRTTCGRPTAKALVARSPGCHRPTE